MTYPMITKNLGDWELQASLTLDRKLGKRFRVGDSLSGSVELTNVGKIAIPLNSVNIFLTERVRGPNRTDQKLLSNLSLMGQGELQPGETKSVRFRGLGALRHPSFRGRRLSLTNRISVRAYTSKPPRGSLLQRMKLWNGPRNNELPFHFEVPTHPITGVYRVEPQPLPTKWMPESRYIWLPIWVIYGLAFFLGMDGVSTALFHWIGLAVVLIMIATWLWRISLFRDSPMEIVESPGGAFLLRMLDRGDNSWQSLHIGYRVTETFLHNEAQEKEKLHTKTIFQKAFPLKEIGQVRGSFIEARFPWPKDFYPSHKYASGQGFGWEFSLLRKNIFGNWSEVNWPIKVSWEHLPPPEEVLELKELEKEKEALMETNLKSSL